MFSNPTASDPLTEEGTVTEVDPIRKVCKVKTLSGQNLAGVLWSQPAGGASRGGDRITPLLGDRVIISNKLGYPIIDQFLPRLQSESTNTPLQIDRGDIMVDTGNFSAAGKNVMGDQTAPKDMLVGDRIISSPGGGMLALLRAGTMLIRSSRLSEIVLSKLQDLVRISSRNFEHFTDASSEVVRNIKGRIYRYSGHSHKIADAKTEAYSYNEYIGDVALAETCKTDYSLSDDAPEATDIVYKEQILDRVTETSPELMKREISITGNHNLIVKSADGTLFTHTFSSKDEVIVSYGDVNVIHINKDEISLKKNGDPCSVVMTDASILSTFKDGTVLMDDTGIKSTYKDGVVYMSDSSVKTTYDGSELKVDSSGITSTKGGAVHKVTSSEISSTCGGHFIKVNSGGVSFG
jgi:hypothetical protein